MKFFRYLVMPAAIAVLPSFTACTPLRNPLMWNGTLESVDQVDQTQMIGSATMTPGASSTKTNVTVKLAKGMPGDVHPWQLRQGQCGSDLGGFGEDGSYQVLKVNTAGRASSTATVEREMPQEGEYYISVGASTADPGMTVACGNLDAPAR